MSWQRNIEGFFGLHNLLWLMFILFLQDILVFHCFFDLIYSVYCFPLFYKKNGTHSIRNNKAMLCKDGLVIDRFQSWPWALWHYDRVFWTRIYMVIDCPLPFYLHLQYNGWWILALAGLFFYLFWTTAIISSTGLLGTFWTTVLRICMSFFLSTLWIRARIWI